jgi:hypothetical protein
MIAMRRGCEGRVKGCPVPQSGTGRYKFDGGGLFGAEGVHYVYAGGAGCW